MEQVSLLDVVGRLLPALVVVVGGLLLVRRLAGGRAGALQRQLRVVGRVGLSRAAQVAVVQVGDLHYLVGATEQSVNLLAELDEETVARVLAGHTAAQDAPGHDALAGLRAGTAQRLTASGARTNVEGPWTGLVQRLQEATLRRGRDPGGRRALR